MSVQAHTIGSKFDETENLDLADVAKLVRADIKQAIKNNQLPAGIKTRVRIQRYSMGQSITIDATVPGPDRVPTTDRRSPAYDPHGGPIYWTATKEQIKTISTLRGILDAYNYDDSDTLIDYHRSRFSGSVQDRGSQESD